MKLYPRFSDVSALTYVVAGWTSAIAFLLVGFEPWFAGGRLTTALPLTARILAWTLIVVFFAGTLVGGIKGVIGVARRHHLVENLLALLLFLGAAYFVLIIISFHLR